MAKIEELSFNEVGEYLASNKTIVIPIGSTEQHSQALPLSTDTLIAESIASKIGESMHWMIGPVINIGYSDVPQPFMKFSGTITYSQETLILVINDYISSLYVHGFRKFFVVNGHGGNNKFIKQAVLILKEKYHDIKVYLHNWWKIEEVVRFSDSVGENCLNHAGTIETALALVMFSDKVDKDKLTKEYNYINTETGVIDSDQTLATEAMGGEVYKLIVEGSLNLLKNNNDSLLL